MIANISYAAISVKETGLLLYFMWKYNFFQPLPDQWWSVYRANGDVAATMVSGDYFGEIGILNISGGVNRYYAKLC